MEAISINIETTDDALKIWLMVKLDVKDSKNKTLGLNSFYFKLQYLPHAYTVMTIFFPL